METTAALTKNQFKMNGTLRPLDKEITQLQQDYEIMKKNREQAKADLQAKFDEVYNKLEDTRKIFIAQSIEINKNMQEFQKKFDSEIQVMEQTQSKQHNQFSIFTDDRLKNLDFDIVKLDKAIEQEKQDRIKAERDNIAAIQKSIDQLFSNFELEKQTRVANEQKNLQKIKDTANQIGNQIDDENTQRNNKYKEIKSYTQEKLESQLRYGEGFEKNTKKEFYQQIDSIEDEMNNRFLHQDNMVDNLRNAVSTIQKTLVILGKDV
ncbi:hypothetical protein pb186bvf_005509 [Paramecium bursaria]